MTRRTCIIRPQFRLASAFRRGATAVEFALTAPILFLLVFGAIEFSRANMLVHTAAIAATEAARRSIVPGATAADCRSVALSELSVLGIAEADVQFDPPVLDDDTSQVTVNLAVPVNLRNGYVLPRIFLGKEVFKSVTLQREGKWVDVADEIVQQDGVRKSKDKEKDKDKASKSDNSGKGNSNSGG